MNPASPAPVSSTATTTIAAIATAPGRGGIGIVRVSGPSLSGMAEALTGKTPSPRQANLARFCAADSSAIDEGILLYFPAPHSFTGEDVLELQGHGGPVVMQLLLGRCLDLGARLAEPGEFTRRAFLNGKLDLVQAEAVADLIDAATASAARSAVRSLSGEFSRKTEKMQEELIELRALAEATLDFPEEEVDFLQAVDARGRLQRLADTLAGICNSARQGQRLQSGLHVVLVGEPNVGKSSLLNCLAGDELAIVTPIAGTTRDIVRGSLQLQGIPLHIIDTAGLRETDDEIEKIGIERTWREIERADVLVLLQDASRPARTTSRTRQSELPDIVAAHLPVHLPRIVVRNKIDLVGEAAEAHAQPDDVESIVISLSAKSGDGIELLQNELLRLAGGQPAEDAFIARERHVRALMQAAAHIAAAERALPQLEFFAEELRLAQRALSEITGEFSADDLLGEIFGRFCIGK